MRKWITDVKQLEHLLILPLKRVLNLLGGDWKSRGLDTLAAVDCGDLIESDETYISSILEDYELYLLAELS